jgi:phosphatidylglycerophosphatase A
MLWVTLALSEEKPFIWPSTFERLFSMPALESLLAETVLVVFVSLAIMVDVGADPEATGAVGLVCDEALGAIIPLIVYHQIPPPTTITATTTPIITFALVDIIF